MKAFLFHANSCTPYFTTIRAETDGRNLVAKITY